MLIHCINKWASATPDKTALVSDGTAMSYSEFACAIDATLEMFSAQRLPSTGTVFVPGTDRVQSWLYILALRRLGLSPLTPMPWIKSSDLDLGKPDLILTFSWRERVKTGIKHLFSGTHVVRVSKNPLPRTTSRPPLQSRSAQRLGDMLLLSSGTTGRYKVLVLPGSDIAQTHESIARTFRLTENTIFNFHGVGPWTGVPKVVGSPPPRDSCLIIVGGGFLSERNASTLKSLPMCRTVFGYAATEASGLLMQKELQAGIADSEHWFEPLPGRRVEVVDEQGLGCAPGVEGTLRVQTRQGDCSGYLGDRNNMARVYADGYFYPGDLATMREDGRIRINGRSADVVTLRSQKISATVIESTVRSALGVETVCAFSGLGENGEEELCIALELPQLPLLEVLAKLEPDLPPFEAVRWVCLPAFPRTDSGLNKIRRNALHALLYPTRDAAHAQHGTPDV